MESKWLVDQKRKEVKSRLRQLLSPRGATTQAAVTDYHITDMPQVARLLDGLAS